jgi:hypothetical protein
LPKGDEPLIEGILGKRELGYSWSRAADREVRLLRVSLAFQPKYRGVFFSGSTAKLRLQSPKHVEPNMLDVMRMVTLTVYA